MAFSGVSGRSWDDLQLFGQVARSGGLSGAARVTGLSAPTIGRRMLALERSLGRTLFDRGSQGYRLAVDGQTLFEHVASMEKAAAAVDLWQSEALETPIVSIGADALTLRFLVQNLADLWTPLDGFRICLKVAERPFDLKHRSFNIAVTDEPVESGNVAVRRSVPRSYAVYAALTEMRTKENWVSLGTDVMSAPWMRWVVSHPELPITAWVNAPRTLLDVLESGAGLSVLPCFVGSQSAALIQKNGPIRELQHDTWIVSHDDDRRRPEIRVVLDRIAEFMERRRGAFAP